MLKYTFNLVQFYFFRLKSISEAEINSIEETLSLSVIYCKPKKSISINKKTKRKLPTVNGTVSHPIQNDYAV